MKKIFSTSNLVLVSLLIIVFVFMIGSAKSDSPTTDESVHLFAGYTYLTERDFRLDPEHPPLLKELAALPLLFEKILNLPMDGLWDKAENFYYDSWQEARTLGNSFLFSMENNATKLIFLGRLPFIFLTLILGVFTYFWSKKLYGEKAGLLTAFLILLMPNILAHGRLINTDLGLTLFFFICLYFWGQFLKKPSWANFFLSGIFLGLVLSSKYTGIIIVPILITLAIVKLFLDDSHENWLKYLTGFLGSSAIAFLIIWASYGFLVDRLPVPIGTFSENIKMWTSYNIPTFFDGVFNKIRPFLFPAEFYKGFFLVFRHALGGHSAYLLGQNSNTGWWYYFPVAIFYKTPLAFFVLLGMSIGNYRKIKTNILFDELLIIIPPIIFLIFAMYSKADLGVRHVLPIFPFLAIYASRTVNLINFSKFNWAMAGFLLLILWYGFSSVINFPDYIAYFNETAGGGKGGYRILTDSNLDWGQDISRIKNYLDENKLQNPYVVYPWDGEDALRSYGIESKLLLPEDINAKGDVIMSATYLQSGAYDWIKIFPNEQITPGVFIFHLN